MYSIAAVVVTHNRKELLLQCIKSILEQSCPCDVLVVDNASTDGTGEALNHLGASRLHYRNTGKNLGGAGGFNFGMRWAIEMGYEYLWIMDDDTIPRMDTLAQFWNAHTHLRGEYGFLSSVVLWTDGRECRMNRQKIKKNFYEHIEFLEFGIIQIEQATFVSLFFPSKVVVRAGLPIREFFIWGDDIEYTRRLSVRLRLPCYLVGQSQVTHLMKNNTGSNIANDREDRIDRYWYAFRNENYTYRQEGITGVGYYLAKCGVNFLRILRESKQKRGKRCAVLALGALSGFLFRPSIEYVTFPSNEQS